MNQPKPDRVFEVDTFTEVITDLAAGRPALIPPPSPDQCVTETCDTFQEFDCSVIYPDDDSDRELRRGA